MCADYRKITYNNHPAFELHHTEGTDAAASTISYPHLADEQILLYFIHGSGTIKVEGKNYRIQEGDLIILNSTELYHCSIDAGMNHERIGLHIGETFLKEFASDLTSLFDIFTKREKGMGNLIASDIAEHCGISGHFREILELIRQDGKYRDMLIICEIVKILAILDELRGCIPTEERERSESSLVDSVLRYINENYAADITVESMAQQFNVSASRLAHLFKHQTGLSLWNYVILRRLSIFNRLVKENRTIEEACYEVGFNNYSNFYRLYRKYMGVSPSQFKKQGENRYEK